MKLEPRGRKLKRVKPRHEFWSGVLRGEPDQCWPWLRGRITAGYGIAPWEGKQTTAHRVAWMLTHGPIGDGLEVDHLCHTEKCTAGVDCPHRRCCNPGHLQAVTRAENLAAGRMYRPATRAQRVTHCPHGHEYTPENTRVAKHGGRNCRQCQNQRNANR